MSEVIHPLHLGDNEPSGPWYWRWRCQWFWPWKWREMNWIDFSVIELNFEWERCFGAKLELGFMLLGFGFHCEYWGRKSDEALKIVSDVDQMKAALRDERESTETQ